MFSKFFKNRLKPEVPFVVDKQSQKRLENEIKALDSFQKNEKVYYEEKLTDWEVIYRDLVVNRAGYFTSWPNGSTITLRNIADG